MFGLIKDLVVTLAQLPTKRIMMNVMVEDELAKYRMLLSIGWAKNLGGTMQMDMKYGTIPMFIGETIKLYREAKFTLCYT